VKPQANCLDKHRLFVFPGHFPHRVGDFADVASTFDPGNDLRHHTDALGVSLNFGIQDRMKELITCPRLCGMISSFLSFANAQLTEADTCRV
jgi:hypothetical protein